MSVVTTLVAPAVMSFRETCTLGLAAPPPPAPTTYARPPPPRLFPGPKGDPPAACAFARTGRRLRETNSVHAANKPSISLQPFRRGFGDNLFQRIPGFVPAFVNGMLPSTIHISVPKFAISILFSPKTIRPPLSHQS